MSDWTSAHAARMRRTALRTSIASTSPAIAYTSFQCCG